MSSIRNIKLEILRSGPAHNQLLSPLTPYLVLCGAEGPVTVNLPFEQRQLLTRLDRLRYSIKDTTIAQSQREAELRELGEIIGKIFGRVPALLSELGGARSEKGKMVHLRLSLSAFELSALPFETAIAADGFPGSGSPLFLQTNIPVTMTREVRRGRPLPVEWNRPSKILFVFANPAGVARVPAEKHLNALRRAIDPWVAVKDNPKEKLREIKKVITILPEATLDQIRQACIKDEYTHIHILAHGASYEHAGDRRYGVALCSSTRPGEMDIVGGERLAIALTMDQAKTSACRGRPTVLSLATCDSANVKTVLTPGGSIAHEIHAAGIPWVFASQFPLWMRASNIFTEVLYTRLLDGADPRMVLHELRQNLRTSCPRTHDWASIVAYATVPWNFEAQVSDFRDNQTRGKIETKFARIDDLLGNGKSQPPEKNDVEEEMESLCTDIREILKEWREDPVALSDPKALSGRLGLSGASEKRIGIAYQTRSLKKNNGIVSDPEEKQEQENNEKPVLEAYGNSCGFYLKAVKTETTNHWVITQYLSMLAITSLTRDGDMSWLKEKYGRLWNAALEINKWQLPHTAGLDRIWANATLAELYLLGTVYGEADYSKETAKKKIEFCCNKIVELCEPDEFPVRSTTRQFLRYASDRIWHSEEWSGLARAALESLGYSGPIGG